MLRRAGAAAALIVTFSLTACSAVTPSSADPTQTAPPRSTRPSDVSVTGIDPCSALTGAQIEQLAIPYAQQTDSPPSAATGNVRACVWVSGGGSVPHTSAYVQGVTYRGFAHVRADPAFPQTEFDVQGYRAITRDKSEGDSGSCEVFVDVAEGQTFETAYDISPSPGPTTACERAKQAADWGMTYLLTR